MRLIGLCGYAGSGKDTVCEMIYGIDSEGGGCPDRVAFADKMKLFAAECFGLMEKPTRLGTPRWHIERRAIERINQTKDEEIVLFKGRQENHALTGRQFLQNMGPAARDNINPDFWIDLVLPTESDDGEYDLADSFPGVTTLIISDVRYENEARRIKELGGEIWLIERPGFESDGHESEVLPPGHYIDCRVTNSGTVDDLYDQVGVAWRT